MKAVSNIRKKPRDHRKKDIADPTKRLKQSWRRKVSVSSDFYNAIATHYPCTRRNDEGRERRCG